MTLASRFCGVIGSEYQIRTTRVRRTALAIASIALCLATGPLNAASSVRNVAKPPPEAESPGAFFHLHYTVDRIVAVSQMHGLQGLAFGPDDALYAASLIGHSIYRINVGTGDIATFLGPPRGAAGDLAFAPDGAVAWTNLEQHAVLARGKDGKIRTLAQNVPDLNAIGFARDGRLFVSRRSGGLYELDPSGAAPMRVVVDDIVGLNAFEFASDGALYGPLVSGGKIVKVNIASGAITDIADGFDMPSALRIEADGHLVVTDLRKGDVVRIDPKTGEKTVLATFPAPIDNLAIAKDGTIYVLSAAFSGITAIDPKSRATRRVTWSALAAPGFLTLIDSGETQRLLIADGVGPRFVDLQSGEVTLIKHEHDVSGAASIAINGGTYILSENSVSNGASVQVLERDTGRLLANFTNFGAPYDVKPIADGFIVADYAVGRLTKVGNDPAHTRTIYAWNFDGPVGLADAGDGTFYVSEYSGGRISRVDAKTKAQSVLIDGLDAPEGITLAPDGRLIVAEVGEKRVLSVDTGTGRAQILADHLNIGLSVGPQVPAPFLPTGVAAAKDGTIYVSGDIENTIYRLSPPAP